MKTIIAALLKLINDCNELPLHHRLNRVCEFITEELPVVVPELIEFEQKYEKALERIAELEQQLKEDKPNA